MSRNLSAPLIIDIARDVTEPYDLMQIDFPSPTNTVYLSSAGDLSQGGDLYQGGLELGRVQFAQGQFQGNFTVNNADGVFTTILNTHTSKGHSTRLYRYYPGNAKVLICEGVLDGGRWNRQRASLAFRRSAGNSGRLPRFAMVPPLVSTMPQPGETVNWGLGSFTFEI